MRTYTTVPLGIFRLMSACFRCYWPIFKDVWQIVLVNALLHLFQLTLLMIDSTLDLISLIITGLITLFLQALLLLRGHRVLSGQPIALKQALDHVKARYLPLLGWMLLMFLLGITVAVVGATVSTVLFVIGADKTVVVTVLLSILLVLVSIVLVYWYFCIPLIVLDNTPARQSFGASFRLIRHHWWRVASVLFIIFFLSGVVLQLLMALVNVSLGIAAWSHVFTEVSQQAQDTFRANIIVNVSHLVVMVLLYPLGIAVTLNLFNDLKLRQRTRIVLPPT